MVALQKRHMYKPSHPLERWMFRVIRNLWLNEIRARSRRQTAGEDALETLVDNSQSSDPYLIMTAKQVRDVVASLDPDIGKPLMMVCDQGYSYREVADALNIPVGTVMSRIHRARQSLIDRLPVAEMCTSFGTAA